MSRGLDLETVSIRRIAVVRALHLGDLLLAVPALRALRRRFPGSDITLIGLPWARAFVRRYHRYIDRLAIFPGFLGIPERPWEPRRAAAGLARLRGRGYDLVVQLHGSGQASNPFVRALGARLSAGYYDPATGESHGLTLAAPYPYDEHEIWRNLHLVALLGAEADDPGLEFPLTARDRAEAIALLRPLSRVQGPLVGLHVGARDPARRWPVTSFAALAQMLVQRFGTHIILTGSMDEQSTVQELMQHLPAPALNLVGRTALGTLGAVLRQLDLFVSNDTGVAHLAYALDVPSITLFGPTDPQRWGPLDQGRHLVARSPVACSPSAHRLCSSCDQCCLQRLAPEAVYALAARLLEGGWRSTARERAGALALHERKYQSWEEDYAF